MTRAADRWLLALVLPTMAGCPPTERRRDDLGELIGDYERPRKNVHGEIEYAKLFISKQGVTGENLPFNESLTYQEVICSAPKSCKIRAILCTLSVEQREDDSLFVHADAACERMAGIWYTKEQSTRVALGLMSGTPATPSATPGASPEPAVEPSDFPSALPSVGPNVQACMRSCHRLQSACETACESADAGVADAGAADAARLPGAAAGCSEKCREKGLSCLEGC